MNAHLFAAVALVLATVTAVFLLGFEVGQRAAARPSAPRRAPAPWVAARPFQGAQAASFYLPVRPGSGAVEEQRTTEIAAFWTRTEIGRRP